MNYRLGRAAKFTPPACPFVKFWSDPGVWFRSISNSEFTPLVIPDFSCTPPGLIPNVNELGGVVRQKEATPGFGHLTLELRVGLEFLWLRMGFFSLFWGVLIPLSCSSSSVANTP